MQTNVEFYSMQFLSFIAIAALGILCLIIGRKILKKVPGLIRALKMRIFRQKPAEVDLQKEVSELRIATLNISEEWADLKHLLAPIKDQLSDATRYLDDCLDTVCFRIQASLDEEGQRNDQRYSRIQSTLDTLQEGFHGTRTVLKQHEELMERLPRLPVTEAWTQTERETERSKKKNEKDDNAVERLQSREIINVIRKALQEFLKEAKVQMSLQRNDVVLDLKTILSRVSQDKEDLKNAVETSFSMTNLQTHAFFQQFGDVGRDAMHCIAAFHESTERLITKKFEEVDEKLEKALEAMNLTNFCVSNVKDALDNIDGQFDEIYKKLELGCQMNMYEAQEASGILQVTAKEWNAKSSNLDETCKELVSATDGIKVMLANLNDALCHGPATANFSSLAIEADKLGVLLATAQACQVKLDSLKDQIDQNSSEVQKSVERLSDELQPINKSFLDIKNSVDNLKNMLQLKTSLDQTLKPEQFEFVGDTFSNLDTVSEFTEESQNDKILREIVENNSSGLAGLLEVIDKAQQSNCYKSFSK